MLIYEPKGKAREYSPLALNIYNGCDHGCTYCYTKPMYERFGRDCSTEKATTRPNFIATLKKEAAKFKGEKKQVLLCFTGDPYCKLNDELKLTRQVLEILLENNFPVAVLTKGGKRCLQDLDLFKRFGENIKVGATLTCSDERLSQQWEPMAALPVDRMKTLNELHSNGIKTWVSFEPVIDAQQALDLMGTLRGIVDEYKIGKLNHQNIDIDWHTFLVFSTTICRHIQKPFYIKKDLAAYKDSFVLSETETDMDYLTLKPYAEPCLI